MSWWTGLVSTVKTVAPIVKTALDVVNTVKNPNPMTIASTVSGIAKQLGVPLETAWQPQVDVNTATINKAGLYDYITTFQSGINNPRGLYDQYQYLPNNIQTFSSVGGVNQYPTQNNLAMYQAYESQRKHEWTTYYTQLVAYFKQSAAEAVLSKLR